MQSKIFRRNFSDFVFFNDSGNFLFYARFCCSFYLSNKTCKHDDDNDDNKLCVDKILNFHPYN